jgi:6-phospho-3-hexuloisomerase
MNRYQELNNSILQEIRSALFQVDESQCDQLMRATLQAGHVFVAGKGRSGLQMRAYAMRLMHLGLKAYVVDEVTTPGIAAGDLLLIGSGSGRTASLIQYARRAKDLGANVGLITADSRSEIAALADLVVEIPAPTPKSNRLSNRSSFQPMGSLFEQALGILLDVLILYLMESENINAGQMFARHANLE